MNVAGPFETKSLAGELLAVYGMGCLDLDAERVDMLARIRRKEGPPSDREAALVWRTFRRDFDPASTILLPSPFRCTAELVARTALGLVESSKSKAKVPDGLDVTLRCTLCRTGASLRCWTRGGRILYVCENQRCVENNC